MPPLRCAGCATCRSRARHVASDGAGHGRLAHALLARNACQGLVLCTFFWLTHDPASNVARRLCPFISLPRPCRLPRAVWSLPQTMTKEQKDELASAEKTLAWLQARRSRRHRWRMRGRESRGVRPSSEHGTLLAPCLPASQPTA